MKEIKDLEKARRVWKIITIVVAVILVPLILLNLILAVQTLRKDNQLPYLFGFSPVVVGESTVIEGLKEDDIIIVKRTNIDDFEPDDVICFSHHNMVVIQKVERLDVDDSGDKVVITYTDDTTSRKNAIHESEIYGKSTGVFHSFGFALRLYQSPWFLIVVGAGFIIAFVGNDVLTAFKERQERMRIGNRHKEESQ